MVNSVLAPLWFETTNVVFASGREFWMPGLTGPGWLGELVIVPSIPVLPIAGAEPGVDVGVVWAKQKPAKLTKAAKLK